jgi:hypothetical protein
MAAEYKTLWDLPWRERPPEEASNLNPAFCGELIYRASAEYFRAKRTPLLFGTSFLILPIVLHQPTRDRLPGNASAAFVGWIAENGDILAELPNRARRLVPITREAILFLLQNRVAEIRDGGITAGRKPIAASAKPPQTTQETSDARRAAALLGRWFAAQGTQASILPTFGVTP